MQVVEATDGTLEGAFRCIDAGRLQLTAFIDGQVIALIASR